VRAEWERGLLLADAQNRVRRLAEMPCNQLTPTLFADEVRAMFDGRPRVTVTVQ
jgi:aminopeptidase